ncbi:hypothetical protein M083_0223 [Bacteroides fragilis str. 3986 T(B)9]|nr:hypothetical protein M083_0223 [Bacteroides fragilis str. 3986 T(B)9]EYE70586.1 hypothetical protein M113_0239 [Bacteroides fragilis str. 3986 N3]
MTANAKMPFPTINCLLVLRRCAIMLFYSFYNIRDKDSDLFYSLQE